MENPTDLKYSNDHAWVIIETNIATIGITYYAQDSMGQIMYVELPDNGKEVGIDQTLCSLGSSKAFVDLPSPLSGKIVQTNEAVSNNPELINESPYDKGWIVKLETSNSDQLNALMDNTTYEKFIEKQA